MRVLIAFISVSARPFLGPITFFFQTIYTIITLKYVAMLNATRSVDDKVLDLSHAWFSRS